MNWIDCNDRMPVQGQQVFFCVQDDDGFQEFGCGKFEIPRYRMDGVTRVKETMWFGTWSSTVVTHWAEVVEPPKPATDSEKLGEMRREIREIAIKLRELIERLF